MCCSTTRIGFWASASFRFRSSRPARVTKAWHSSFAFLSIYLWVFRRDLRFPNVLLLFPICIAAIWFLNALRIALLVSIGSHVSPVGRRPRLSLGGGLDQLSRRYPEHHSRLAKNGPSLPRRNPERAAGPGMTSGAHAALTFLAPFMALVAASLLASAFAPHDQWLYAVKVAAVGAALWCFRDAYLPLLSGARWSSIAIGLAVGILWIAIRPR